MLFSSSIFLFYFFPIVLILYFVVSFSRTLQNAVLLTASLFFYVWGADWVVLIMILSILVNYLLAMLIHKYREAVTAAKAFVIIACIYNIGMLFVFKYLGFVLRNINSLQGFQISIPNIALPIGISFFTFKSLSYIIDVYRQKIKVEKNPFYVGLYIAFFPQLLAGPISRYGLIGEQIRNRKITYKKFSVGCCRFITGMGKKVLISNTMAIIVDRIFEMNTNMPVPVTLAWLGSIAYTLQIFFDFSGYSDMAIGLGLMFGFKFEENFKYPYISRSITEFWRRWHISLGSWFRDYVYIPLGGSRVANKDKIIRNLFIVWILTGIWHGAEWTFVAWGFLNFICIAFEKIFSFEHMNINSKLKHFYALFIINLGWVMFRSKDLREAGSYIRSMLGFSHNGFWSSYTFMFLKENIVFFIAAILLSMPIAPKVNKLILDKLPGYRIIEYVYPFAIIGLFLLCVTYIIKGSYNPFIYFKF